MGYDNMKWYNLHTKDGSLLEVSEAECERSVRQLEKRLNAILDLVDAVDVRRASDGACSSRFISFRRSKRLILGCSRGLDKKNGSVKWPYIWCKVLRTWLQRCVEANHEVAHVSV